MKNQEAVKLKPNQKVIHRRYGVCVVQEVVLSLGELFGVIVTPANQNGRDLLAKDSGTDTADLLEDRAGILSIEKKPDEPGYKPIDHETVWGVPEEDLPAQEPKDHFAPDGEGVPE